MKLLRKASAKDTLRCRKGSKAGVGGSSPLWSVSQKMKIWIDGSGWNGRESKFAVVFEDGRVVQETTKEKKTNNVMEYESLIKALESCKEGDEIFTDSQLLVGHVLGGWKVRKKHLLPYVEKAQALVKEKKVKLIWIPREENKAGKLFE